MVDANDERPSDRLRTAREGAGYDSAAGASRAQGWSPGTYRHHENGTRNMPVKVAEEYAKAYGVTVGWLLGLTDRDRRSYAEELQRALYTDQEASSVRDFNAKTAAEYGIVILHSSYLSGLQGDQPSFGTGGSFALDVSVLEQLAPGRSSTPLTFIAVHVDIRVEAPRVNIGAVLIVDRAAPRIRRQGATMLYTYAGFAGVSTMYRHPDDTVELLGAAGDFNSLRVPLKDVGIWGQVLWIGQGID